MSNACSLSFSMHGKNTLSEHSVPQCSAQQNSLTVDKVRLLENRYFQTASFVSLLNSLLILQSILLICGCQYAQ